ncbi:MAG: dephospho-CoA kinase [Myxococcaceae bacterium]|nr:dephospho-CoA kinase [Myxococcaceae bacterium]
MKLVGLTGGIASGKSVVAAIFRQLGVPVIDADELSREVLTPKLVVEHFGAEFAQEGQVNRKKLGTLVFANPTALRRLEDLTHPLIMQRFLDRVCELGQQGHECVIYEAALIFEKNLQNRFDAVILVSASEEVQIERLLSRELTLTRAEAWARIKLQMPNAQKKMLADHVIENI